jgi:hypothetical protein
MELLRGRCELDVVFVIRLKSLERKMANKLSAALAFFNRRLGFIADKRAMIVFFAIQSIHRLMSFRPAGHLNKAESFRFPRDLIDNKLSGDYTAKFAK